MSTVVKEPPDPGAAAEPGYRYWAFISYSHRDERWAQWLHRSLESYRIPGALVGTPAPDGTPRPSRLFPLFRDRDELAGAPDLGEKIQEALRSSRNLIVICSPHAAGSEWVNQEIAEFKASGREERVFCLVVDGEPNATGRGGAEVREAFPEAIRYHVLPDRSLSTELAEPLAADARPQGDGRRFALLKLLAGILDVQYDALRQREQERRIRRLMATGAVLAAAVVVLAGLSWYAFTQRNTAQREGRASRAALSGQLATHAQLTLPQFSQRSLLLGVEALRTTLDKGEPAVPAAESALRAALARSGGRVFGGRGNPVQAAELSPDGRWLFAADSATGRARLWDLSRQQAAGTPLPGAGPAAAFSADGRWLATASDTGGARLWDLSRADFARRPLLLAGSAAPLVFTADRRWLATAGGANDPRVRLWELARIGPGARAIGLRAHHNRGVVLAASPDGRWLVTSSWTAGGYFSVRDTAWLWNLATRDPSAHPFALVGTQASVSHAVFSPDGRWLATASAEHLPRASFRETTVFLWDLARPDPSAAPVLLDGHHDIVTALAMSADGRWLASGSADSTVRVWSLSAPDPRADPRVLAGHEGDVYGVGLSPDGRWLASAAAPGTPMTERESGRVRFWNLQSTSVPPPTLLQDRGRPAEVRSFTATADGRRLLVASGDAGVLVRMDADDPAASARTLAGHEGLLASVALSSGGRGALTLGGDGTVRVWEAQGGAADLGEPAIVPTDYSRNFATSPDDRWLLTWRDGAPGVAVLWEMATLGPAARPLELRGHTGRISTAVFSPDGRWVVTAASDSTVRLWPLSARGPAGPPRVLRGHTGGVNAAAFSPDGRWLVSTADDSTARVWSLAGGQPAEAQRVRAGSPLWTMEVSPDSRWAVARGGQSVALLWELGGAATPRPVPVGNGDDVRFSPDSRWLVVSGKPDRRALTARLEGLRRAARGPHPDAATAIARQRQVNSVQRQIEQLRPRAEVWDLRNPGAAHRALPRAEQPLAFSPDGRWVLTLGGDSAARLWRLAAPSGDTGVVLRAEERMMLATAEFSPDGRWLAIGSFAPDLGRARLWELDEDGLPRGSRVLATHRVSVDVVAFSPDGRRLLTASTADDSVRVHPVGTDSTADAVVLPVSAHRVWGAAFTKDGRRLVTASYDTKTASVWELDLERLIGTACRTAGRNLTREEWHRYFPAQPYRRTCPGYPGG